MKTSWLAGIFFTYALILGIEMMLTGSSMFDVSKYRFLETLMGPAVTSYSSTTSGFTSFITGAGAYIQMIMSVLLLWSATLWAGTLIWVWVYVCLPIALATMVGLVFVLRGVGSS